MKTWNYQLKRMISNFAAFFADFFIFKKQSVDHDSSLILFIFLQIQNAKFSIEKIQLCQREVSFILQFVGFTSKLGWSNDMHVSEKSDDKLSTSDSLNFSKLLQSSIKNLKQFSFVYRSWNGCAFEVSGSVSVWSGLWISEPLR